MSEKESKIIRVPDSRWREGKPRKKNVHEVFGSLDFGFCRVPYDLDGNIGDLYEGESEEYKEGVEDMREVDIDTIPSPLGLSLNMSGVEGVNDETNGALLHFLNGGIGQRYIMLAPRRQQLDELRKYTPRMSTEFRRRFLEVFVRNADLALERYGDRAALLIL